MAQTPHILLIAGSAEAHEIADRLARSGQQAQAILRRAERSFGPLAVPSQVWSPQAVAEMEAFLQSQALTAICDAGHGFDADISDLVWAAAQRLNIPYRRLLRAPWTLPREATAAPDVAAAANLITRGARVFATTGRGTLDVFDPFIGDRLFLRQTGGQGRGTYPDFVKPVFGTPPFTQSDEAALFQLMNIDTLICRNVGGIPSWPKLDAALQLGLRTIVIDRPPAPEGALVVADASTALDWLKPS